MNREIEELESQLRTALQAKSHAVTAPMLRKPPIVAGSELSPSASGLTVVGGSTATEPEFDPNRSEVHVLDFAALTAEPHRRRQARWFAPALAAAAVIALAAGAAAVVNASQSEHPKPNPPATGVHTTVPSPSRSTSTPSATPTATGPVAAPYLGAGKTGSRDQVPWSQVGTGWRLLQPTGSAGSGPTALYLYDPAGGRYLITDQLPNQAYLQGWSPDGQRAMTQAYDGDYYKFQQVDLHTGQLLAGFRQYRGDFISYTQPHGLAVMVSGLVQGSERLLRYGTDGTLQLAYPPTIGGLSLNPAQVLYTKDGAAFVAATADQASLISNSGQLIRSYPGAAGPLTSTCQPVRWWTGDSSFLESCTEQDLGQVIRLYVQPVSGGAPSLLVGAASPVGMGYSDARQLSNGDVLLTRTSGCGSAGYDILHPDGSIAALRLPDGVPAPGTIQNLDGDVATFRVVHGCGDPGSKVSLIDYNMVTGATSTLLNSDGIEQNYPGE